MKKYYYHDGFREFGPFTPEELYQKRIRGDSKVRQENTVHWIPAKEVAEIAILFKGTQPVVQSAQENSYSYQQEPIQEDGAYAHTMRGQTSAWREKLVVGILIFWLFHLIIGILSRLLIPEFWESPVYGVIQGILGILFALIPLLLGASLSSKFKTIGIIVGGLISLVMIVQQIEYLYYTFI